MWYPYKKVFGTKRRVTIILGKINKGTLYANLLVFKLHNKQVFRVS